MEQANEFVTEPFDCRAGGVVYIEAVESVPQYTGAVDFVLEGSEDKSFWTGILSGVVCPGQRQSVPCRPQGTSWGRLRLRQFGGDARMRVRWFREGDR